MFISMIMIRDKGEVELNGILIIPWVGELRNSFLDLLRKLLNFQDEDDDCELRW